MPSETSGEELLFGDVVSEIKSSPEHKAYYSRAMQKTYKSWVLVIISFGLSVLMFFLWVWGYSLILISFLVVCLFVSVVFARGLQIEALNLSREADRFFFLECIRAAKSVDDLNYVGLFAPAKGWVDISEERRRLIQVLRTPE